MCGQMEKYFYLCRLTQKQKHCFVQAERKNTRALLLQCARYFKPGFHRIFRSDCEQNVSISGSFLEPFQRVYAYYNYCIIVGQLFFGKMYPDGNKVLFSDGKLQGRVTVSCRSSIEVRAGFCH